MVSLPYGFAIGGEGGDATAHRGRADVARAETGDGGGAVRRFLGGGNAGQNE